MGWEKSQPIIFLMIFVKAMSEHYSNLIDAQLKQCWHNSFRLLEFCPNAYYVEGWAKLSNGLVFEHGWNELDNKIIDVTLVLTDNCLQDTIYQKGLRLNTEDAREMFYLAEGEFPLVNIFGKQGLAHNGYRNARDELIDSL